MTFLFTDVVGSTELAERFPLLAPGALARQHELIRGAADEHGGRVFERIGDAAYAAFDDSSAALDAAMAIQSRLAREDWGEMPHLQVRIALDAGAVEERDGRFYGAPLFRAARLQGMTRGGEILLTAAVADAAQQVSGRELLLRDHGTQRLRGLVEPVHVFGLNVSQSEEEAVADDNGPIRVMLVDDHAVVRRGLRGYLELLKDIEVIGEAEDGLRAVELADRIQPDVILMDLLMPNMDGLTAIGRIKEAHPEIEIVAVTSFIEEEKVTSALEAGASGYLLKDADAEEVAGAVRAAHAGEVHLDPAVARLLAQRLRTKKTEEPVEPLTTREKEVLSQLAKGASNKEIAYALDITERTARTHVSNILGKLGLASRTQAALYAVEHKLV